MAGKYERVLIKGVKVVRRVKEETPEKIPAVKPEKVEKAKEDKEKK